MGGGAFVGDHAHIRRRVRLGDPDAKLLAGTPPQRGGEVLPRDERNLDGRLSPECLGPLEEREHEARGSDDARNAEVGEGARLDIGVAGPARDGDAPQHVQRAVHHVAGRGEVERKGHQDDVPATESGGVEGGRQPPVIPPPRLGVVDRAGRDIDPPQRGRGSAEQPAERQRTALRGGQSVLPENGEAAQRLDPPRRQISPLKDLPTERLGSRRGAGVGRPPRRVERQPTLS